ncbi:hypothetical protein DFJ74DRAFT_652708 [Hyaloraphidium curvatum]|nr:hypothetical protein DFJ74DRAFT_652708 [Hyaloraphidium curvatum]
MEGTPAPFAARRVRRAPATVTPRACAHCRAVRHKCDGAKPRCGRCSRTGRACDYGDGAAPTQPPNVPPAGLPAVLLGSAGFGEAGLAALSVLHPARLSPAALAAQPPALRLAVEYAVVCAAHHAGEAVAAPPPELLGSVAGGLLDADPLPAALAASVLLAAQPAVPAADPSDAAAVVRARVLALLAGALSGMVVREGPLAASGPAAEATPAAWAAAEEWRRAWAVAISSDRLAALDALVPPRIAVPDHLRVPAGWPRAPHGPRYSEILAALAKGDRANLAPLWARTPHPARIAVLLDLCARAAQLPTTPSHPLGPSILPHLALLHSLLPPASPSPELRTQRALLPLALLLALHPRPAALRACWQNPFPRGPTDPVRCPTPCPAALEDGLARMSLPGAQGEAAERAADAVDAWIEACRGGGWGVRGREAAPGAALAAGQFRLARMRLAARTGGQVRGMEAVVRAAAFLASEPGGRGAAAMLAEAAAAVAAEVGAWREGVGGWRAVEAPAPEAGEDGSREGTATEADGSWDSPWDADGSLGPDFVQDAGFSLDLASLGGGFPLKADLSAAAEGPWTVDADGALQGLLDGADGFGDLLAY